MMTKGDTVWCLLHLESFLKQLALEASDLDVQGVSTARVSGGGEVSRETLEGWMNAARKCLDAINAEQRQPLKELLQLRCAAAERRSARERLLQERRDRSAQDRDEAERRRKELEAKTKERLDEMAALRVRVEGLLSDRARELMIGGDGGHHSAPSASSTSTPSSERPRVAVRITDPYLGSAS
jgi:hypothetical protein